MEIISGPIMIIVPVGYLFTIGIVIPDMFICKYKCITLFLLTLFFSY